MQAKQYGSEVVMVRRLVGRSTTLVQSEIPQHLVIHFSLLHNQRFIYLMKCFTVIL